MATKYTEIFKLKQLLDKNKIKYDFTKRKFGLEHYQITLPAHAEQWKVSVIEGQGTFGSESDTLEAWFPGEADPTGFHSSEEVLAKILAMEDKTC